MKSVDQKWNKTADLCFISGLLVTGLESLCFFFPVFQLLKGGGVAFSACSILPAQTEWKKENQRDVDGLTQELRVWEQLAVLILSNIYE